MSDVPPDPRAGGRFEPLPGYRNDAPPREFPWLTPMRARFLLAALGFTLLAGTALGAVNLFWELGLGKMVSHGHVQTHGHSQLFGFVGLFVCGFAYHLVPRLVRRPLPYPRLAAWTFWPMLLGPVMHWAGQPLIRYSPAGAALLAASGPLVAVGFGAFAVNLLVLLRGVRTPDEYDRWLRPGLVFFALAAGLDAVVAPFAAWTQPLGLYPPAVAQLEWHLALSGTALLFVVGVTLKVAPPLLGVFPPHWWALRAGRWLLLAAIPLQAAGLAAQGEAWAPPLELSGRALGGLALLLVVSAFRLWQAGVLPAAVKDPFFPWAMRFALGSLGLAGAFRLGTALAEVLGARMDVLLLDAERHLVTKGFLVGLILAMSTKLLPGLLDTTLRAGALRWWSGALLALAVAFRVAQVFALWGPTWPLRLAAVSGLLGWLAIALMAGMILATVRGKKTAGTRP